MLMSRLKLPNFLDKLQTKLLRLLRIVLTRQHSWPSGYSAYLDMLRMVRVMKSMLSSTNVVAARQMVRLCLCASFIISRVTSQLRFGTVNKWSIKNFHRLRVSYFGVPTCVHVLTANSTTVCTAATGLTIWHRETCICHPIGVKLTVNDALALPSAWHWVNPLRFSTPSRCFEKKP